MPRYIPLCRPASFCTLPADIGWRYIEAPAGFLINRPDLPTSRHCYGVIETDRALTAQEVDHFDLRAV